MKYVLKDKEKQKAFEKFLPDFTEEFQKSCECEFDDNTARVAISVHNIHGCWSLAINKDEIECIPTYDPKAWNKYPEVEPPEGELMRVERCHSKSFEQHTNRGCAFFMDGCWFTLLGSIAGVPCNWGEDEEIRFRPWED